MKKVIVFFALTAGFMVAGVGWSIATAPTGPNPGISFPPIGDALAADSCNWNTESNGCQFGICVDDKGTQYCVRCCNNACNRVSCNE